MLWICLLLWPVIKGKMKTIFHSKEATVSSAVSSRTPSCMVSLPLEKRHVEVRDTGLWVKTHLGSNPRPHRTLNKSIFCSSNGNKIHISKLWWGLYKVRLICREFTQVHLLLYSVTLLNTFYIFSVSISDWKRPYSWVSPFGLQIWKLRGFTAYLHQEGTVWSGPCTFPFLALISFQAMNKSDISQIILRKKICLHVANIQEPTQCECCAGSWWINSPFAWGTHSPVEMQA